MTKQVIAILEDEAGRQTAMRAVLQARFAAYTSVFHENAPDMIEWLRNNLDDVQAINLDHDLGPNQQRAGQVFDPGTGRDVADFLATHSPHCPVLLATTNSLARPGMRLVLEDSGWVVSQVIPSGDLDWVRNDWAPAIATMLGQT